MNEAVQYDVVQAAEQAVKSSDNRHQLLDELLQGLELSEGVRPVLSADTLSSGEMTGHPVTHRSQLPLYDHDVTRKQGRLYRPVLMRGITI